MSESIGACAICGGSLVRINPRGPFPKYCDQCRHGTVTGYGGGCRCDQCRGASTTAMADYSRRFLEENGFTLTEKYRGRVRRVPCTDCGRSLTHTRLKEPRCTDCKFARRALLRRAANRRRRCQRKLAAATAGVSANPRWPLVQGICARCGDWFTRRGEASSYCSSVCRRKGRRKDRRYSGWISAANRQAIYERDCWTCQICFHPVDPDLHYLDDMAASLDHIEPRSWALIPDDRPSNLRMAHRICNSRRGDESWAA